MNCKGCGKPVPPGQRYCKACGLETTNPEAHTVLTATGGDAVDTTAGTQKLKISAADVMASLGTVQMAPAPALAEDPTLVALRKELAADYEVSGELGRGGMAIVYKAREIELNRLVALKLLPPEMGLTPAAAERFKREARLAAGLDHPSIIPIYRVGGAVGSLYFAMKFVEGRALDEVVANQGALPIPVVLAVLRSAVSALAYAHDRNIVHRDIKGANILVDVEGRVTVSDFGIARATEEKGLTATGAIIGTPHFMSPEQCQGLKVGPQSDQYSMGVFLFQMLTGQVPFDGESMMTVIQHHFFTPPPDVTAVRAGVPPVLLAVLARALAKAPEDRFATTREMLHAIEAVPFTDTERYEAERMLREMASGHKLDMVRTGSIPPLPKTGIGRPPTAPIASAPAPAAKRRTSMVLVALGAVVLAGAAGGGAWLLSRGRATATSSEAAAAPAQSPAAVTASVATPPALSPQPQAAATTTPAQAAQINQRAARTEQQRAGAASQTGARTTVAPAAPAPAPAAAAAGGFIRVSTNPPDAEIFINGSRAGSGALVDQPIPSGRVTIRITSAGYVAYENTVTVGAGETLRLGRVALHPVEGGP